MKKIIILSVILFCFSGCDSDEEIKDPEPVKEDFYAVEIAADFDTDDTDDWVLASDVSGTWLDAQPFEGGQTIHLNGNVPIPETFNLTFLTVTHYAAGPRYNFSTYSEMPVDGTWKIKHIEPNLPTYTPIGTAVIKLKNFTGDFKEIKASGITGNLSSSRTQTGIEVTMQVSILEEPTNLVLSFRSGDDYRSKVIENVTKNSITTVDALEVDVPENNYRFSFPNNNFYYIGFYGYNVADDPKKTGYIISEHIDYDGGVPGLLLGYNPGYEKYKTIISYGAVNYYQTYYKFGSGMAAYPDFSEPSAVVSNQTIKDFSWNPDFTFSQSSAFFQDPVAKNVNWEVVSAKKAGSDVTFAVEQFPTQLLDVFPTLNIDNITYLKGNVALYLDGFTYENFIDVKSNSGNPVKQSSDEYYYYEWRGN